MRALAEAAERSGHVTTPHPTASFGRTDVTLLLNALRCGVTVQALAGLAPGMRPERLLAAYVALDAAMQRAASAWRSIENAAGAGAEAFVPALAQHAVEAAKLFPVQVVRLSKVARQRATDLPAIMHRMTVEVSVQAALARRLEVAIERLGDDEWAADLGALLYDAHGEAVANRADFLPERVGLLSSARVAALLGEREGPEL